MNIFIKILAIIGIASSIYLIITISIKTISNNMRKILREELKNAANR